MFWYELRERREVMGVSRCVWKGRLSLGERFDGEKWRIFHQERRKVVFWVGIGKEGAIPPPPLIMMLARFQFYIQNHYSNVHSLQLDTIIELWLLWHTMLFPCRGTHTSYMTCTWCFMHKPNRILNWWPQDDVASYTYKDTQWFWITCVLRFHIISATLM